MDLMIPNGKALSYLDLMDIHPELFYDARPQVETWPWHTELATPMPIRPEVIGAYCKPIIERSFPRNIGNVDHLPNIVELTAWWLTHTIIYGGHDMRSYRTPSSTHFGDRVICVKFVVNTHLATCLHDRRNVLMISPDGTEQIIP
jgi:hypothetical protein